jgi:hypothetical protein
MIDGKQKQQKIDVNVVDLPIEILQKMNFNQSTNSNT